jgi:Flp pilus assembly protein TadD
MPTPAPRRAAALLAVALPFAPLACAFRHAVPPRASEEVRRGYAHLAAGDDERAEVAFDHALAFDPELPEAENGMGIVLRTRGDLAAARRRFERAVRLRPDFAEGHANLGELHLAAERASEAEGALRTALRIDPDLADARLNLARALLRRGLDAGADRAALFRGARTEYLHLLEAAPDAPAAHHDLAFMAYLEGRFDRAEAGYRRAAELAPASHEAHHGLCIALVRLGRCDEGARACERCLELAPAADRCRASLAGARACGGP